MLEKLNILHFSSDIVYVVFILAIITQESDSSYGDRSNIFQNCMHWCGIKNCTNATSLANFKANRPWYMTFLQWECWDECDYLCMWHAVKVFQTHGQKIPQFHGKWPFYRFCGIQEPASFLFSILNGFMHYYMWGKFRKAVSHSSFKNIWNVQALLSINAWFWSAVFHARDTPVTEKLDYFCAFSLVLYSFYSLFVRIIPTFFPVVFYNLVSMKTLLCSRDKSWISITVAMPFLSYFIYHIYYLTFVRFDYGYNMKANILIGLLNSCGWMMWCYKHRYKQYVWKCAVSVLAVNMLLLLELCDFPPWKFLIDAHALWHLGTIPVPLLWYSFLIEDCLYEKKIHEC